MQKLGLSQQQTQHLSPQQIQYIKLLQIPVVELEKRIEEELENNPVLEEGKYEEGPQEEGNYEDDNFGEDGSDGDDRQLEDTFELTDYLNPSEIGGYKMQGDGFGGDEEERESPIAGTTSLTDNLITQLGFLRLNENQHAIGLQLIGSIESDGYIRRDLNSIVNDLAFSQYINVEFSEVETVLKMIQQFDPPGIAARNLQECLLIQLEKKEEHSYALDLAIRIVEDCFDEFTKKHYEKISVKLNVEDHEQLKDAVNIITKCNPKPGETSEAETKNQIIIPDFLVVAANGKLEVSLNAKNAPELRVSNAYTDLLVSYDKSDKKNKEIKETVMFVKQKLDAAKWFIDAIKQRQQTLLLNMNAIATFQRDFFFTGDESMLRPMILKDIAEMIDMDISTVSRVASSKYVQTEFGTFPLKYFFSEGISTDSGEEVSNKEVKSALKSFIDNEDKKSPLSDEKLEQLLNDKGYNIARRTVAKYREQLNIPVARLRKEL